jgi:hypothetical protein
MTLPSQGCQRESIDFIGLIILVFIRRRGRGRCRIANPFWPRIAQYAAHRSVACSRHLPAPRLSDRATLASLANCFSFCCHRATPSQNAGSYIPIQPPVATRQLRGHSERRSLYRWTIAPAENWKAARSCGGCSRTRRARNRTPLATAAARRLLSVRTRSSAAILISAKRTARRQIESLKGQVTDEHRAKNLRRERCQRCNGR